MALTASVDLTKNPAELTVVSDRRRVTVNVHAAGDDAVATGAYPVTVSDSSGRVWTVKSDDAVTAVYTG